MKKLFQVFYDATTITLLADNKDLIVRILADRERETGRKIGFVTDTNGNLLYRWGKGDYSKCEIIEVDQTVNQVIQWESH